MFNKSAWLAALVALACGTSAQADFFTQLASINEAAAGGPGVVTNVRLFNGTTSGGGSFGNYFQAPGGVTVPNGTAPMVGGEVHIVGADFVTGYSRPAFQQSNYGGNKVVAVFALKATIESIAGGTLVAHLTEGAFRFYASPDGSGTFDPTHPTTWGATNAAGTMLLSSLADYILKPDENVLQGHPDAFGQPFAANMVNRTAVNASQSQFTDGNALFQEVRDPQGFIDATTAVIPGNLEVANEGLFTTVRDLNVDALELASFVGFTAADRAALNTIYASFVGSSVFANFGAGDSTDYLPNGNPLFNGDAALRSGTTGVPGVQPIPEPTALLLCSVGLACLGAYNGLRRYRKVALAC
ncbi:MAG: hypothetical protein L0Z62_32360 [Gemmataceae bacterium]|nr:hypothetical protein [Gemmataceae bacterium]